MSGVLYVELLNHDGYQADVLYDNANIMTEMLRPMRQTAPFPFLPEPVFYYPESVNSVMMIMTFIFEQMSCYFEGAMGFHCNRKVARQMTRLRFNESRTKFT